MEPFNREGTESWKTRWFRLTGEEPGTFGRKRPKPVMAPWPTKIKKLKPKTDSDDQRGRHIRTPEHRKIMSIAQKKRWAKRKTAPASLNNINRARVMIPDLEYADTICCNYIPNKLNRTI